MFPITMSITVSTPAELDRLVAAVSPAQAAAAAKLDKPAKAPAPEPEAGKPEPAASTPPAAAPSLPTAEAPVVPPVSAENSAPALTYDDLKKAFFEFINAKGVPAGQAWLKEHALLPEGKSEHHLTAAKPEQYGMLRADLLARKAA